MAIDFLTPADVLQIHERLIRAHGGNARLRDEGLLLSAIAMPQAAFFGEYAHPDISEMAAAYLYHLVMNHPFVDGNKRTGAAAAIVFLAMNDIPFTADNNTLADFTFQLAQGKRCKAQTTEFIRSHTKPTPPPQ